MRIVLEKFPRIDPFDILAALTTAIITVFVFVYKLGQTSLVSWDEAWYAEIARNIVKTGDLINLTWNGGPYFDHPPTGFWLMALFYKIFGVNEFWTRFPSVLAAAASMMLLYFLGKKLFNPLVGFCSGIALSSAFWFSYRARSGNLDIFLTMFFLLTILLALKAAENKKYSLPFAISLSLLFLTKTMVPLTIIPVLAVIFYTKLKQNWRDLVLPAGLFLLVAVGWFAWQIAHYSTFISNYFGVGLRGVNLETDYLSNLRLAKDYLYFGVGRWFWLGIGSLVLSVLFRQKRFLILETFFISFTLPVLFSHKIQIWHLVPLHAVLILAYFGFTFTLLEKFIKKWKYQLFIGVAIFSSYIYLNQMKVIWYQFVDIPAFISDEEILSEEAGKYPQKFLIDDEYIPAAVFYSQKDYVGKVQKGQLVTLLKGEDEFLLITNKWRLEDPQITDRDYTIIKQDRDKVLILHQGKIN